jgi:hypothetical protein
VIARAAALFSGLGRIRLSIAWRNRSKDLGNVQVLTAADALGKTQRHIFQTPPGICIVSQAR